MDTNKPKSESQPKQVFVFDPNILNVDATHAAKHRITRQSSSRIFWSGIFGIIILLCIVFPLGWSPSQVVRRVYDQFSRKSGGDGVSTCSNDSEIVRPFINNKTTFDLVATFWIKNQSDQTNSVLHNEVLFKDIRLDSLPLSRTIELDVPVAPFKLKTRSTNTLRVGYSLIPTDSLINPLLNPNVNDNEREIRRFCLWCHHGRPLSDAILETVQNPSLREFISDTGISESLVDLVGRVQSPSPYSTNDTEGLPKNRTTVFSLNFRGISSEETSDLGDFSLLYRIITQSWLILVPDGQSYNISKCNNKPFTVEIHGGDNPLEITYRDGTMANIRANKWVSRRVGPFDRLVGLKDLATNMTEWFYPPHLSLGRNVARSNDTVPIWSNLEADIEDSEADAKPATIRIPWTIYFSLDNGAEIIMTEPDVPNGRISYIFREIRSLVDEIFAKLHHLSYVSGSTRVAYLFDFVSTITLILIRLAIEVLKWRYWITRTTTAGIVVTPFIVTGLIGVGNYLLPGRKPHDSMIVNWHCLARNLLALYVLLGLRLHRTPSSSNARRGIRRWVPISISQRPASKAEKISTERYKTAIGWRLYLPLLVSMILIFAIFRPFSIILFESGHFDVAYSRTYAHLSRFGNVFWTRITFNELREGLTLSSWNLALLLQLYFNYLSGSFATIYPTVAVLFSVYQMTYFLRGSVLAWVHSDIYQSVTLGQCITAVLDAVGLYQALRYPQVDQESKEIE